MSKEKEIQILTEQFRVLGAYRPEDWARSQVEENIPQYARFVFLRHAWEGVISDRDTSWIDEQIEESERRPRAPGAGVGLALKKLITLGATREDISDIVRGMQWLTLAHIAYQLCDPGTVEYPSESLRRVKWSLFETDEEGQPMHLIDGLHESVLDVDPSGREMRPRGVGRDG